MVECIEKVVTKGSEPKNVTKRKRNGKHFSVVQLCIFSGTAFDFCIFSGTAFFALLNLFLQDSRNLAI
jgi:hypothetical protein